MCVHICTDVCVRMCADMRADIRADMHTDVPANTFVRTVAGMLTDMRALRIWSTLMRAAVFTDECRKCV